MIHTAEIAEKKDEELLALSQERPEVFSMLVDRYQQAFLRKSRMILRNEEAAEDAVQEAFVKIYTKAHLFHKVEGASFKSWAYKVLMNECFTIYRKAKKDREVLVAIDREIAEIVPDRGLILEEERKLTTDYVLSMVSKLPEVFAKVITMHFVEDRPQREIAEKLGISENAVRTRIHRAKKELKNNNVTVEL